MSTGDQLERYYTEKLWDWIPEVYRHEDGIAQRPGVLRALVEIVGAHAAEARRGVNRLWDNQFAELADDWALPYIGDLVGTRLVSPLNRAGRRADVARTIFYRRRKGTVPLLETLIREIGRWDGVVVEAFRRLGRTPHRLDAPLAGRGAARMGPVTRTPPGGTADLRASRGGDLVGGPFEEYVHTADVRQLRGELGRFNITKLNFHLFRQIAYEVPFATPLALGNDRFTFDPSGREIPLFRRSQQDEEECTQADEWRIAAPLPCRLLGEARYRLSADDAPPAIAAALSPLFGVTIVGEPKLRAILATLLTAAQLNTHVYPILAASITEDSPRAQLIPSAVSIAVGANSAAAAMSQERVVPANLALGATFNAPAGKTVAVDPQRGQFRFLTPPAAGAKVFVPKHHYGLFGPCGAGTYSRRETIVVSSVAVPVTQVSDGGLTNPGPVAIPLPFPTNGVYEITDNKTYHPASPAGGIVTGVSQLTLQAADERRPYVRLIPQGGGSRWTFRALPKPPGFDPTDPGMRRTLVIDGLWLSLRPSGLSEQTVTGANTPATPVATTIALDGVFDQVIIRHCTIDPGGEQARVTTTKVMPIPAVQLELRGAVEELIIERSIVGPIRESATAADPCSAARVIVRDSIVQSTLLGTNAIETRFATVTLERSTVLGSVVVNRLIASETLVTGEVRVTDKQHGCFRFSATIDVATSRLPRQFESHLIPPVFVPLPVGARLPRHILVSTRFGEPGFAQLSETAPEALRRGAENGSEIGAWSRMFTPIKFDDLKAKVAEYMPFGLVAQFITET